MAQTGCPRFIEWRKTGVGPVEVWGGGRGEGGALERSYRHPLAVHACTASIPGPVTSSVCHFPPPPAPPPCTDSRAKHRRFHRHVNLGMRTPRGEADTPARAEAAARSYVEPRRVAERGLGGGGMKPDLDASSTAQGGRAARRPRDGGRRL